MMRSPHAKSFGGATSFAASLSFAASDLNRRLTQL
jgi:hypothetical protein